MPYGHAPHNGTRHGSLMFAPGAYLHGTNLSAKKTQHLVHFVHAQGLLALLQLTDKAQTNARLVGQVYLSEVKLLSHFFNKICYQSVVHFIPVWVQIYKRNITIIPFRV